MRRLSLLLIVPVLAAVGGCNAMMASPAQFDAVRARLAEDKKFRDTLYRQCVKDFSSVQSFSKTMGVLLDTQPKAAVDLTCRRTIAAIVEKRLTYNDLANLARLAR